MLPVLSLLSACTVAFVPPPPPQVMFSLRSTADAHAAAYASPRCRCRNLPRSRSRYSPQRVQRPLLRAGADGQEGGAEDGDGDGGDVAGAGMGLDGAWQVKSGQVRKRGCTWYYVRLQSISRAFCLATRARSSDSVRRNSTSRARDKF